MDKYKMAFDDISATASKWVSETLFDRGSTPEEIRVALAYLVGTIETHREIIRNSEVE